MPEANDNAQTASLTSLALPRSRFANMTPVQQARVCMQRDLHDLDAVVRTDTRLPSPTGAVDGLDATLSDAGFFQQIAPVESDQGSAFMMALSTPQPPAESNTGGDGTESVSAISTSWQSNLT